MSAKRALSRFRAPGEPEAEERAWEVVRAAYQDRLPAEPRHARRRPAAALAVAFLLIGALALSPAGATVGRVIGRALGVHPAEHALLSLPAPGRLLVSGTGGTWTVATDGSRTRVGAWTEASWSPHGLYLTVAGADQLAALSPRGAPEWILTRPRVSDPRWYPPTGYRVAYLSSDDLRVVAGDGTGDHVLAAGVAHVPPAWRPRHPYQLAYVTLAGLLVVSDTDRARMLWSTPLGVGARQLIWSANGTRLVALTRRAVRIYTATGRLLWTQPAPRGVPISDAALSPNGHTLALVLGAGSSEVVVEHLETPHPVQRRVLAGSDLGQLTWAPNGRWLLISWPAANQWVFVRMIGRPRIQAVSRIAQQFSIGKRAGFPHLDGWCCTATGNH